MMTGEQIVGNRYLDGYYDALKLYLGTYIELYRSNTLDHLDGALVGKLLSNKSTEHVVIATEATQ